MNESKYMIQLDGVRAIAALAVIVQHSYPPPEFRLGNAGVRLFFVLSGFLITGILLRERDSQATIGDMLNRFYARRVVRIFPLFYFAILLAYALQFPGIRDILPW